MYKPPNKSMGSNPMGSGLEGLNVNLTQVLASWGGRPNRQANPLGLISEHYPEAASLLHDMLANM